MKTRIIAGIEYEVQDTGTLVPIGEVSPNGQRRTSWTAAELMAADFPAPRFAVPDLIPEGLTFFAGAPKLGKSWLALGLGIAVSSGGRALGTIPVDPGEVLYLALEDSPRRLQERLEIVLAGDVAPPGLHFQTEWPRMGSGGAEHLTEWIDQHEARVGHHRRLHPDPRARVEAGRSVPGRLRRRG